MALPAVTPLRKVIKRFHELGWTGPVGGRHQFMVNGTHKQRIPNTHGGHSDVRAPILKEILAQAGISEKDWHDG